MFLAVRILREAGSIYSNDLAELEDIADQKETLDPTLESEVKKYCIAGCSWSSSFYSRPHVSTLSLAYFHLLSSYLSLESEVE